jgi:hypothetical protein
MFRFPIYTTAALAALMGAVAVAGQSAPESLDATMRRVGPAAARATEALESVRYEEGKAELPAIRAGITEAERFFAGKGAAQGVALAKDVLAKLGVLEKAIVAAEASAAGAGAREGAALEAAMRRVGPAAGAADEALVSMDYAAARAQLRIMRAGLTDAQAFFAARSTPSAVRFAQDAIDRIGELDALLGSPDVDQTAAEDAMSEVQGACGACHTVFRTRDEDMNLVLRPGAAPTAAHVAMVNALKDVQGGCNACHTVFRANYRGDWILKPGSVPGSDIP